MIKFDNKFQDGSAKSSMIITISLIALSVILTFLTIWSFINYIGQKTDVDSKINTAVATAKKDQADADEIKFAEREKEPNREFVGPDDYGRVTFNYPKTWSVYVSKDAASGGVYEAYMNPIVVPLASALQQFALRVTIEQKDYDKALAVYDPLVKKGDLKSSSVTIGSGSGVRLDGSFSKDIRGAMVLFKIRDKTLTVRTDANTFITDFDDLVSSITFNQ